jgi:hypothetical protein
LLLIIENIPEASLYNKWIIWAQSDQQKAPHFPHTTYWGIPQLGNTNGRGEELGNLRVGIVTVALRPRALLKEVVVAIIWQRLMCGLLQLGLDGLLCHRINLPTTDTSTH